jgi:hypothetical protein
VLAQLPPADAAALTGNTFFPALISGPFEAGLHVAFGFAIAACLVAAVASLSRGTRYVAADLEAATAREAARRTTRQTTQPAAGR